MELKELELRINITEDILATQPNNVLWLTRFFIRLSLPEISKAVYDNIINIKLVNDILDAYVKVNSITTTTKDKFIEKLIKDQ